MWSPWGHTGSLGVYGDMWEPWEPVGTVGTHRELWKLWGQQGLQEYVEAMGTRRELWKLWGPVVAMGTCEGWGEHIGTGGDYGEPWEPQEHEAVRMGMPGAGNVAG